MSLKFLEDWLLFLGGMVDAQGAALQDIWHKPKPKPIKLATYDTKFVESVCGSIKNGIGLTDRQVVLAVKIILKYKRQWTQIGMDPSFLEYHDVPLRLVQREVDRTHAAWIEDQKVHLKFPYDPKIISKLNTVANDMPGNWMWDAVTKKWSFDLLECNIHELTIMKILTSDAWKIDPKLQELMTLAAAPETAVATHPALSLSTQGLILRNCPDSLVDSMKSHGFSAHSDVLTTALLAFKHGVSVDKSVLDHYDEADPRRTLLLAQIPGDSEYPGRSNMTWSKLEELMRSATDLNYVFVYRNNVMPLVMDRTKDHHACNKEYIVSRGGHHTEVSQLPQRSVVISDILIGTPYLTDIAMPYLAMLYMIADDGRIDA